MVQLSNEFPKVAIIISTYNGEKYIREQLDSIFAQTYKNFHLYIRDDCSKDRTAEAISEYVKKYDNISFEVGKKNLGYPTCFFSLMDAVPQYDYYFFGDQDDVWLEEKIERAVSVMEKYDTKKPIAYYAGYELCNEKLQRVETIYPKRDSFSLKDTMYELCSLEFTIAVNDAAMSLWKKNKPAFCNDRASWMSMLFSTLGTVVADRYSCALYRRHENAFSSKYHEGLGLWIHRLKTYLLNDGFSAHRDILIDFYGVVGHKLNAEDKKMLQLFSEKRWFPYAFLKLFYPKRLRYNLSEEIALRVCFLIGKL